MKQYILSFLLISIFSVALGQTQPDYWELLLNNNREEALEKVNAAHNSSPSIETLIAKEIIRNESGLFSTSSTFIPEFIGYNHEEMLYPLWNEAFIFDDYANAGIDANVMANVNKFRAANINHPTLKNALTYLKAVTSRYKNNFEQYRSLNRGIQALRNWQYCGVFENLNGSGLETVYGPELHAYSEKDFDANSNGLVNWYFPEVSDYEAYSLFTNHREYGSGVHYAQTFLTNPTKREVYFRVGASSKFKLWVNDVEVLENALEITSEMDAYSVKLTLPAGVSRILIKVADYSDAFSIVRVTDKNGVDIADITTSNKYSEYNSSTKESLNPVGVENYFESHFKKLRSENPNNFFYDYLLIQTYFRDQRYTEAREIIDPLMEKYPKSSIVRVLLMTALSLEGDSERRNEVQENLERDDEKYFLSMLFKFQDVQELFRMSITEMEDFIKDFKKSSDLYILKVTAETLLAMRQQDAYGLEININELVDLSLREEQLNLLKVYAPLYGSVLSKPYKTTSTFNKINKSYFDYEVRMKVATAYDDQHLPKKAIKVLKQNIEDLDTEIAVLDDLVGYLHYLEKYEESMEYIDRMEAIFPYSFTAMEYRGDALVQLGDEEGAIKAYEKYLIYNSANSSIRNKIRDIRKEEDIVEKYKMQDVYDYIDSAKGQEIENNYGYNVLLDEAITELFPEAGGKSRYTYIYEITAEEGVERMKEYNLGLSGYYNIIKSEIVKANGSIVPADRSGSSMVFTGLEVGDVIYIDYQKSFTGYGRFFRDFERRYQFDSYHPIVKETYTLLVPKGRSINYTVSNGELDLKESEDGDFHVYNWTLDNYPGFEQTENYMPYTSDFARILYISSISDWDKIGNWYSDLVRSQKIVNSDVQKVFDELFPEVDVNQLSEMERAKRIYYYIEENMTYSYVSFRQSGFVPQKPATTIKTKLGDCKDFSMLYVTLAKMANLDANLVLVLTSDNGDALNLPSTDFNHCIAKVNIDNEDQYLELTDKYLPFAAIPRSDRNAIALEIQEHIDNNYKAELIRLSDIKRLDNRRIYHIDYTIMEDSTQMEVETILSGTSRAWTMSKFDSPSYDRIEKEVSGIFEDAFDENVTMDTVILTQVDKQKDSLIYHAKFTLKEKPKKIGSVKILELPSISNGYTKDLISEEKRNYPIKYSRYEGVDQYKTVYNVKLTNGQQFVELPENVSLTYKNHKYVKTFKKIAPNQLEVTVEITPGKENISTEEYAAFKKYVESVIEAKEAYIGYK